MLPYCKILTVQLLHFGEHFSRQFFPEGDQLLSLIGQILKLIDNLRFQIEYRALQSQLVGSSSPFVHAEKLKVAAQIKDIKLLFVFAVYKPWAQASAPPDHLPELGLAHHLFEEHQIQHLRHINTGIQHIYGNSDLRQFFRIRELINGTLGIGHVVVDHLGITGQMGIFFAQDLQDFLSMTMVFRKDNRLAQFFAVVDLQAMLHQDMERLADGILIEHPLVQLGRADPFRQFPLFICKGVLILFPFRFWKVVIDNAFFQEFQLALHLQKVHQKTVLYRLGQLIAIGGDPCPQFKDIVGVLVDLILGGGGKTHQGRVKVIENIPVFVVDGAVSLITDDKIKMSRCKQLALLVLHCVDAVHHGLVGGKDAPGSIVVLLLAQISHRQIWQQIDKTALGLGNQRVAVRQEENIFDPAMLQKHIHQGNHCTGLSRAGGHHQQSLPAVLGQSLTGGFDCPLLVVPSRYFGIYLDIPEACPHSTQVKKLLQIPPGVKSCYPPFRINTVVNPGIKPIGKEDHRTPTVFLLQNIRIQLGLLTSLGRVHAGALCLNHRQRTMRIIIKHIVGIAHLALVGHTGEFHLIQPVLSLGPACVSEHGINIEPASLILREIQGLGCIAGLLGFSAGSEFRFEGFIFRNQCSEIHLRNRSGNQGLRLLVQQSRVKFPGSIACPITAGDKIHKVPKIFQTQLRLSLSDLPAGVSGGVAGLPDILEALPQIPVHDCPEVIGIHEGGKAIIKGHDQGAVHRIHPFDSKLHRPAAVQHTGRQVDLIDFFCGNRYISKGSKLRIGEEKIKVGHGITPYNLYISFNRLSNFFRLSFTSLFFRNRS